MGANSKIEWTDHTFNLWRGCQHAVLGDGSEHPGCANCYAEAMSGRNPKLLGKWGPDGTRVMASAEMWRQPLKWNREAEAAGVRDRVFCASLSDVFEEWDGPIHDHKGKVLHQRTLDDLRRDLFQLIDATPWLDWILVTKRPGNVLRMWPLPFNGREPSDQLYLRRNNCWLLTSISNQDTADELVPQLLACRDLVPVLGLSCEPLLGPINLRLGQRDDGQPWERHLVIDWVIVGGESGHNARPMHPDWARSLRDQCQDAGVPFFFKQWGKKAAGRLLDGREWNEFPAG